MLKQISFWIIFTIYKNEASASHGGKNHHGIVRAYGQYAENVTRPSEQHGFCDVPLRYRVTCGQLTEYQCGLAGCCVGAHEDLPCYTDMRRLTSKEHIEEHPCWRLPSHCEVIDRTPCDRKGKTCGIGIMTELRKCAGPSGLKEAKYTHRLCCNPSKMCTENSAIEAVMCSHLFPECEPSAVNHTRRQRRDAPGDEAMCDRVSCGHFDREDCALAGCDYDPSARADKCYTSINAPAIPISDYPCLQAADTCAVTDQSPCDLRGKTCGLGVMTETRTCTADSGAQTTSTVSRMCCIPGKHCPGTGPSPFVSCSHVFPVCERRGWRTIHRPQVDPSALSQAPECSRVPCRQYRNPECEYAGCTYDPDARIKCYRSRRDPPPEITDYPCKKLSDDCELVSRSECDLRGRSCGIGQMTEVWDCTWLNNGPVVRQTVGKLCCDPDKRCPVGTASVPLLVCAHVYPDCEDPRFRWARQARSPYNNPY